MPTFLSDPPQFVYLVLALVLLVAGGVWFNRRDRKSLAVLGGVTAVVAVVILIDLLFESPREESVRLVNAMVRAVERQNPDEFVSHIADTLTYRGEGGQPVTVTRDQVRKSGFWGLVNQYKPHIAAWDFARDDVKEIDPNTVEIGFLAKGEAQGQQVPMYFRATFQRQPDGRMKLTALASFDPLKRTNERKSIPNFP